MLGDGMTAMCAAVLRTFPASHSPDKPHPMPLKVAAFYQFASLPDFRQLREPLRAVCAELRLKGSVLLAHEGINGTLAGEPDAIDSLIGELRDGPLFGARLDNLELKFSTAAAMPAPIRPGRSAPMSTPPTGMR